MEYAFHVYNRLAADGATMSLHRLLDNAYFRKKHKTRGDGTQSNANLGARATSQATAQIDTEIGPQEDRNSAFERTKKSLCCTPVPPPIIVCVGSDLAIGDSLGPITGSMLQYKTQGLNTFIYGTLSSPITAKEIGTLRAFLRETHRDNQILAIDAAVGDKGDIGLIKLSDTPLLPGAGANKKLGAVGDVSIMAVVAEKSIGNYGLLNTTRLNLVYTMSEIISDAVAALLWERCSAKNSRLQQNACDL
ncbi:MAG: spore protease YyaC [Clostridiales bacterium]|nr:spore protease YyaC [Clostridiales bacterium]